MKKIMLEETINNLKIEIKDFKKKLEETELKNATLERTLKIKKKN